MTFVKQHALIIEPGGDGKQTGFQKLSDEDQAQYDILNDIVSGNNGTLISYVPSGNISATTLNGAIAELDTEKASVAQLQNYSFTLNALDIITKGPWVDVRSYGVVADGVTDNSITFQNAINAIVSSGKHKLLVLPPGVIKINSGIIIDVFYVSVIGNGTILDFSDLSSGTTAITLTSNTYPPFNQSKSQYSGFEVLGNDNYTGLTTVGLKISKPTSISGEGPSHITMNNISIHGFGTACLPGDQCYVNNFIGMDFQYCKIGLDVPISVSGGERLSFLGCTIASCDLAVRANNSTADIYLTNCSLDYNKKQIEINGARVFATDCHIEGSQYLEDPISVTGNGGIFSMRGGVLINGDNPQPCSSMVNNTADANGGAFFDGVQLHNLTTSSIFFAEGTGKTVVKNSVGYYNLLSSSLLVSSNSNLMADGSFEESSFPVDNIFINDDTSPIITKVTGTNIALTQSNTYFHSGSKSLKMNKQLGGSGSFCVAVPVPSRSIPSAQLFYKKPGSETGTIYITAVWANLSTNDKSVPVLLKASVIGGYTLNFTATPEDWTPLFWSFPELNMPSWATHFVFIINAVSFGTGIIYFDDFIVTTI